jgi:hypothetical protein
MPEIFIGDPSKCTYCASGQFPHQHQLPEEGEVLSKSVGRRLMTMGRIKTQSITDPKPKRGRPLSEDTIELFRTCEYNGHHPT